MNIWDTRNKAIEAQQGPMLRISSHINGVLSVIDHCIIAFTTHSNNDYMMMCSATLLKAKNYAVCSYSLILDGYGQEAGACIRPFVEYMELITYIRRDPNRVKAIENRGKLPTAGEIAKAIEGDFKGFRDYLNQNASHKSFSTHSLNHLLGETGQVMLYQPFDEKSLAKNLKDLYVLLALCAREAVAALNTHDKPKAKVLAQVLKAHQKNAEEIIEKAV